MLRADSCRLPGFDRATLKKLYVTDTWRLAEYASIARLPDIHHGVYNLAVSGAAMEVVDAIVVAWCYARRHLRIKSTAGDAT